MQHLGCREHGERHVADGSSIVVTAYTYADLLDSELDRVANALDGLGD